MFLSPNKNKVALRLLRPPARLPPRRPIDTKFNKINCQSWAMISPTPTPTHPLASDFRLPTPDFQPEHFVKNR